jgi:SAM-dependent methyltransferase
MAAPATSEQIRDVNARYHDVAAGEYDTKWGIDFGETGQGQVLGKLRKVLGGPLKPFARSLEVGAGTGYFTLNLLRAGVVQRATCTDLSRGMLTTLSANAARLGLEVDTARADAEALPFAGASFDLLLGHAVLHHIPDLERAFAEFTRVLAPGGTLVFAGEPSRRGDRLAAIPKRVAMRVAPAWRAAVRAAPARNGHGPDAGAEADDHELESQVDVHAFEPRQLASLAARAGLVDVRVRGEELLANWFGWTSRTLEATAEPGQVPWRWKVFAYRGYLWLQEVDRRLLEPRLPPAIFYNLILAAQKPA